MAFDVNFAFQVMLPAANAAYQIMNNPAPPLPAGYALVGEILADPEQAANATAAATPLMQGMVAGMLLESPICGLVAWNAATATALVSFRGTQTIQDWAHNLDAAAVFYIPTPGDGLVHMGFQLVYEHLAANVRILLSKCVGMKQILVTGHSLGGAVAILGALDIYNNMGFGLTPLMYTFAGPRVAAPDFASSFNNGIPVLYRIINTWDLVPQVPLPPYIHVGQEVLIDGGANPFNPVFNHSLSTYGAGLLKLPGVAPGSTLNL
jgi:triacylglycerol lipase